MSDASTEQIPQNVQEYVASVANIIQTDQGLVNRSTEERLEILDKSIALLLPAYLECVSLLQALVAKVVNGTPEEEQEFYKLLKEGRKDMMTVLTHGMKSAERDASKFVASPSGPDEGSGNSAS